MIIVRQGDILQCSEQIIGHQVNCLGAMGSGLADKIHKKYPIVFSQYEKLCNSYIYKGINPNVLLGQCQYVSVDSKIVVNMFGQLRYGREESVVYTIYGALRKCLENLYSAVTDPTSKHYNMSIALPYGIGAGLAKGDWTEIEKMINDVFYDYDITLYKYDK